MILWNKIGDVTVSYTALIKLLNALNINSVFKNEDGDLIVFFKDQSPHLVIKKEALPSSDGDSYIIHNGQHTD